MGSRQIDEIAQNVDDMILNGPSRCVSFECPDDPKKWVQFKDPEINASHPAAERRPDFIVEGEMELTAWDPSVFVGFTMKTRDPVAIAERIDWYFRNVLGCADDYALNIEVYRV